MGNALPTSARSDDDIESHWSNLPSGTKQLFHKSLDRLRSMTTFIQPTTSNDSDIVQGTEEVMFSSPGVKVRDGLDLVINFVILSSQLLLDDEGYHWDLDKSLKSAYILAASFLLKVGRGSGETTLMIFYASLLKECLSRGYDAVLGCWVVKRSRGAKSVTKTSEGIIMRLRDGLLFSELTHLHNAVVATKSTSAIVTYLTEGLSEHSNTKHLMRRVQDLSSKNSSTPIHTFSTSGAIPRVLMEIKCRHNDSSDFIMMSVYDDTTLKWIFKRYVTSVHGASHSRKLLCAERFPGACIWDMDKKCIFYLATSGDKTLEECGIKNAIQVLYSMQEVNHFSATSNSGSVNIRKNLHLPPLSKLVCGSE